MTKSRTISAAAVLMIGCAMPATVASAQDVNSAWAGDACVGLACEPPDSAHSVPETRAMMPRVAGPDALRQQRRLGFYEFGAGTLTHHRAVAYVIPKGHGAAAATSIQRLPSYQALANVNAFDRGASVIFAATVAEFAAEQQIGTLAYGDCPGGTTCIWEDRDYQGRMLQFSSTGYWQNLGNYGFNDSADSIANKRSGDSLLAEHTGGGGDRYCYDSYSASSSLGGFGDDASSIFLSSADSRC